MAETSNNSLIPRNYGEKNCSDPIIEGIPSNRFDFVLKPDNHDNIPPDVDLDLIPQCPPWYYYNMKVGSILVLEDINLNGNVFAQGTVSSNGGTHILSNKKNLPFDMPHPNKKGWRLRHVCIEGPEIAVYCRGRLKEDGIIMLPSFWKGLVNTNDLSINLTPIGQWQELFVEKITEEEIIVKNNIDTRINADYHIIGRRLDDDLIVEYEGESYEDYPDGNEGYSFNYDAKYVENLIRDEVKITLGNLQK
jgi:hypothetical protein